MTVDETKNDMTDEQLVDWCETSAASLFANGTKYNHPGEVKAAYRFSRIAHLLRDYLSQPRTEVKR